jgi:oligopeptide transport system permease protein
MAGYALRRLLQLVPVFLVATLVVFVVVRVLPGDPVQAQYGERKVPDAIREQYERRYHFDEPLWRQYLLYVRGLFSFDLGESVATQRPVTEMLREALPRTATLAAMAVAMEVVMAVPLGIWTARRRDGWFDNGVLVTSVVFASIPVFALGSFLQWFLGAKMQWFPVARVDEGLWSYVLPSFVLAVGLIALTLRLTRSSILETMGEDYIRTARAKGVPERRLFTVHGLRNALIPVITVFGIDLGVLLGGAVVVETIFQIPGIGLDITNALDERDNVVITSLSLVLVGAYLVLNLLIDLLYAWLDPRIRYE